MPTYFGDLAVVATMIIAADLLDRMHTQLELFHCVLVAQKLSSNHEDREIGLGSVWQHGYTFLCYRQRFICGVCASTHGIYEQFSGGRFDESLQHR